MTYSFRSPRGIVRHAIVGVQMPHAMGLQEEVQPAHEETCVESTVRSRRRGGVLLREGTDGIVSGTALIRPKRALLIPSGRLLIVVQICVRRYVACVRMGGRILTRPRPTPLRETCASWILTRRVAHLHWQTALLDSNKRISRQQ